MRCPKCSFISFDLVESCVKCGKNISEAATELKGTVAGGGLPTFLRKAGEEDVPGALEETTGFDTEEVLDLGAGGEEEVVDFSFDEEPSVDAEIEAVEMEIGEVGEAEEAAEIDLGFEEEAFGISDLAPEEEVEDVLIEEPVEEEFEVAVEDVEAAGAGQGLEDLKVEGIDLESTPGVSESGKVMPSVKTGTALDDFDIDLGDLLTDKDD